MTFSKPDTVKVYTHTLTITKVDGKNQTPLAGAEFELYEGSPAQGSAIKLVKENTVNGNNEYRVADTTDQDTITKVVSPENGKIVIKGLNAGTYNIKRDKSPSRLQ